jgi:vancomycin resistance protein VanW
MKKLIPSGLKVRLKVSQRYLADFSTGNLSKLVKFQLLKDEPKNLFKQQIIISQALRKTYLSENKIKNLSLAITRIQDVAIQPNEIFSFWHLVGKPDKSKGYLEGRALVNNQLQATVGGGLCQLSGMIYLLTLKAGIATIERHTHSQDIYTEETRFAPLGSDATIVYGYKDLRFINNLPVPICFRFNIQKHEISAALCSPEVISEQIVEFKREEVEVGTKVDTVRFGKDLTTFEVLNSTIYKNQ